MAEQHVQLAPTASDKEPDPSSPSKSNTQTLVIPSSQGRFSTSQPTSPASSIMPQFQSALSYAQVRDFAYPDFHPLHYGVAQQEQETDESDFDVESYRPGDGPPWQEDDDLVSPVVTDHEINNRITREYEFSASSADEVNGRAIALFDFYPENENEAPLREGQIIWVSYRHGQGWLVAEVNSDTGETGLVPEGYVELIPLEEARRLQQEQQIQEEEEKERNDDNETTTTNSNINDTNHNDEHDNTDKMKNLDLN